MKSIILKVIYYFKKYYFIEDIENYCSNSHKEYYHEECINLFLSTSKNKKLLLARGFKVSPEI